MFTGIVEATGRVDAVEPGDGSTRLRIASALGHERLRPGDSLAVDGVCLTVVDNDGSTVALDAVAETLARTTLGALRPGAAVHLERALRAGDPLGGHLVQGHVDGTGEVRRVRRAGDDCRLTVEVPAELSRYVAFKGSIALSGVSLTVAAVEGRELTVALIPTTLERTHLGAARPGERLNVEVDVLARYLERLLEERT